MKPPAASPGRAEKPQQLPAPAPPGLARLLLSKSRRGGRSRRAPATSPMFVSRGHRSRAADGEPSSPKVTCIGQVRMRKGKGKKKGKAAATKKQQNNSAASAPENARGYCRCLKKAFLCGGLFDFDRRRGGSTKAPSPETERVTRRSPWVFSSRDVAVAAAPKPVDARSARGEEEEEDDEADVGVGVFGSVAGRAEEKAQLGISCIVSGEKEEEEEEPAAQLVSSATTTPPKNALLLMRCRSAPQNRTSPLTSRFPVFAGAAAPSPSPTRDAAYLSPSPRKQQADDGVSPAPSPSPRKPAERFSPAPSPSPRKSEMSLVDEDCEQQRHGPFFAVHERAEEAARGDEEQEEEEADEDSEEDEMRCSSARPLVLQRCKSEPATTAAAKMAGGGPAENAATAGCFWANGGSSGRRRHAPPPPPPAAPAAAAPVALTGH